MGLEGNGCVVEGGPATRLAVARRALSSLPDDPRAARRSVLGAIRHVVPGDFGLEYRTHYEDGWLLSADLVTDDPDWMAELTPWVGSRIDREVHSYDPELPDPREVNRFIGIRSEQRELRVYQGLYAPNGLTQLRALAYDGTSFLGWVAVLRAGDRPPFSDDERRALDRLAPSVARSLAAVHTLERAELDAVAPGHLVFSPEGRLEHATEPVTDWLTEERRAFLGDFVACVDRGEQPATALDGASISVRRLVGERTMYLVNLAAERLPQRSVLARLSGRRREVAELAAAGATAKEVAEELGISPHTVRQHLKVVYRDLGVASRVDLARLVESESAPRTLGGAV
jgi:DNA-binding CsgD family transcriptional regulator